VRPETALLVAIIIAICAVLAAGGAMLTVRAAARGRAGLVQRRESIARTSVRISRESADVRDRVEHVTAALEQMRVDGTSWDADMRGLTGVLQVQREGIERMTQGRLATFIRLARLVSKAAQFAFLWR
jgi:hypothetical protein